MRVAWLLLLGSVAVAAPPKPVRKPPPANLEASKLATYVDAVMADKAGDWERAIQIYRRFERDAANIQYNIADLYRRSEEPAQAIEYYKKYLAAAPDATDRAIVQRLIEQLQRTPQTLVVDGDDFDAVVFIDGKPVGPSPYVGTLADGRHEVVRIGPASFAHDSIDAKPLGHKRLRGDHDQSGNVVLGTSLRFGGGWMDGDTQFRMNQRFTLPPGRVDTYLFEPSRACSPLSFVVPTDGVVYVYIDAGREWNKGGCTPIKVTAQKLVFPKAAP